ncbi:MAG: biotin--[acetyl-CoA-carboxylase] ligase [Acidobacteriota bacterium]|nr:biotin--[acetyl-CoA-carboxylase] ligase [Acidobacteriota bacterium]
MHRTTWDIEHLEHVDSTNAWMARQARGGATGPRAVYCDYQSEGRGRMDRVWHAPAGSSLLCSVLVASPPLAVAPQWVVIAAALAVADALEGLGAPRPVLKWPNDVLYGERKVAGLLAEFVTGAARTDQVVVGLGLNLTDVDPSFDSATTVLAATAVALEPVSVLEAYLDALESRQRLLAHVEGRGALRQSYLEDLSTLGRGVRVELADGVVRGRAVGVDEDGALVVEEGDRRRVFAAGDVVHLRGEDNS